MKMKVVQSWYSLFDSDLWPLCVKIVFFYIDLGFHDEVTKGVFVETSWVTTTKENLGITEKFLVSELSRR